MGQALSTPELQERVDLLLGPTGYAFSYGFSQFGTKRMATHAYCERVAQAPGSGSLCTASAAGDVVIQVVLPGPGDRRAASVAAGLGSVTSDTDPASSTFAAIGEEASAASATASAAAAEEEDEPINLAQYLSELGEEHGAPYHDHLFFGDPDMTLPSAVSAAHNVRDLVHVRSDAPVAAARAMLSRLAPAAMAAIKRAEDAEAVAAAAAGAAAGSITTLSGGHGGSMHFSHVDAADKQTDICDAAHGNLVPVKGVFEGADGALYIMFPAPPGTLQSVMQFSPSALSASEFTPYLLAYQLVSAVQHCHARGLVHGDLRPCNVLLTDGLWVWLTGAHGCIHATPGATALLTEHRKQADTRSPPALDSNHERLAGTTEHHLQGPVVSCSQRDRASVLPVTPRLAGDDKAGAVRTLHGSRSSSKLRRTFSSPVFRLASQEGVAEAEAVEVTAELPRSPLAGPRTPLAAVVSTPVDDNEVWIGTDHHQHGGRERRRSGLGEGDEHDAEEEVGTARGGGVGVLTIRKPTLSILLVAYADGSPHHSSNTDGLQMLLWRWRVGQLSNLDYLLALNQMAGRHWGNRAFHAVVPWVIDMSCAVEGTLNEETADSDDDEEPPPGWRDMRRTKLRLNKGDEQLDFTYGRSEVPHHVSDDVLSELAVCIYKARRLPPPLLQKVVRAVFEPNEYPSSMERLYQWTPDECLPDFYDESAHNNIFQSLHANMTDLKPPAWAASPQDFLRRHRQALESPRISSQLHHWIDLTFGYALTGEAAVRAKNVALPSHVIGGLSADIVPYGIGRTQLFVYPHPQRRIFITHMPKPPPPSDVIHVEDALPMHTNYTALLDDLEHSHHFCARPSGNLLLCSPALAASSVLRQGIGSGHAAAASTARRGGGGGGMRRSNGWDTTGDGHADDVSAQVSSEVSEAFEAGVQHDLTSLGLLIAEMFLRRPMVITSSRVMLAEITALPMALQPLVRSLVLQQHARRHSRPSAADLLHSTLFPRVARDAVAFLAPLHAVANGAPRLSLAAAAAREGKLAALPYDVLMLVAPTCVAALYTAAHEVAAADSAAAAAAEAEGEGGGGGGGGGGGRVRAAADVAEGVAALMGSLSEGLHASHARSLLLPVLQGLLGGNLKGEWAGSCTTGVGCATVRTALLAVAVLGSLSRTLGPTTFLTHVHPLVLHSLQRGTPDDVANAAATILATAARRAPLPQTLRCVVRPLVAMLGEGSPVVQALLRVTRSMGEATLVRHLLPALLGVLTPPSPPPPASHNFNAAAAPAGGAGSGRPIDANLLMGAVDVLEGLLPRLPASVVSRELLPPAPQPPSPLVAVVMYSATTQHTQPPPPYPLPLLKRVVQCLLAATEVAGLHSVLTALLPQLQPFFEQCAATEGATPAADEAAGAGTTPASGTEEDGASTTVPLSVKLELLRMLYPTVAQLVGMSPLRAAVPQWSDLEHKLYAFFSWVPDGIPDAGMLNNVTGAAALHAPAATSASSAPSAALSAGLREFPTPGDGGGGAEFWAETDTERAVMLLDGIIPLWASGGGSDANPPSLPSDTSATGFLNKSLFGSSPAAAASSPLSSASSSARGMHGARESEAETVGGSERSERSGGGGSGGGGGGGSVGGGSGADWGWVPRLSRERWAREVATELSARRVRGAQWSFEEPSGQWALSLTVVHQWQACKRALRCAVVTEDENMVITAGAGAASDGAGTAVRCWDVANNALTVEYNGHQEAVAALTPLAAGRHVASCDAGGHVHVWSTATGERLVEFAHEGANRERAEAPSEADGTRARYSCIGSAGGSGDNVLLAGTTNGYVHFLDVTTGSMLPAWRCAPAWLATEATGGVSKHVLKLALGAPHATAAPSWVGAAFANGALCLLDARAGAVTGAWYAHDEPLTVAQALGEWGCLTAARDRTMALWDVRALSGSKLQPVQTFHGHKETVASVAVHRSNILSVAGARIGVSSMVLAGNGTPRRGELGSAGAGLAEEMRAVKVEPLRLRSLAGGKQVDRMTSIQVLPHSQLFLVATEDGTIKICS